MANLERFTRDTAGVVLFGAKFDLRTLTAAGAETWPAGAVLGRVTVSGKFVRYDPAASDGSEVPTAILTTEIEFTAAGDRNERPLLAGEVRRSKLVDANDTALTDAAVEQLRDFAILAKETEQLQEFDN